MKRILLSLAVFLYLFFPTPAEAHWHLCHLWHSCEPHYSSYKCGDLGVDTFCNKEVNLPTYTYENVTEIDSISFQTKKVDDETLASGEEVVDQFGASGEKEITYLVTYKDNIEVSRSKTNEVVTKKPVNEILLVGTKVVEETEVENVANKVAPVTKETTNVITLLIVFLLATFGWIFFNQRVWLDAKLARLKKIKIPFKKFKFPR